MVKRLGILTGGGDCPGLNAVIRAVVKTATGKFGYEVIGFRDGYKGLVENFFDVIKLERVSGILDKGGTILGTSNFHDPYKFIVRNEEGKIEYKDLSDRVVENIRMHDIECLITVGGEGTLNTAKKLSEKGLNIVGIPKTIDNDVSSTDMTFGFMTAVEVATEAIDRLHSTAESHHRIMVVEVMGRYTGWIAMEAGMAGGADIILIPEIEYDINKVARAVIERKNSGKSFSLVVVAEGAVPIGGKHVITDFKIGGTDPVRLGGIGNVVATELEDLTGLESRVTVLGHLQRGGRPNAFDRILSSRYGAAAVELALQKDYGKMVSLRGESIKAVTLDEALDKRKVINKNGDLVRYAKNLGVAFGD